VQVAAKNHFAFLFSPLAIQKDDDAYFGNTEIINHQHFNEYQNHYKVFAMQWIHKSQKSLVELDHSPQ
jgi:hypothetical protein